MSFSYLLLGHIIGDFTLQTDRIASNKARSWKWNLVHSVIVTVSVFLFSIPFGYLTMLLAILNGALHFLIDYFKSKLPDKSPSHALFYFIADQGLHIYIIYKISTYADRDITTPILNNNAIVFLVILFCVFSVSAILIQYVLRILFNIRDKDFFINDERIIGNLTRISLFFIFILSFYFNNIFIFGSLIIIVVNIIYYKIHWHKWMAASYFIVKLSMDMIIPLIGLYLLVSNLYYDIKTAIYINFPYISEV